MKHLQQDPPRRFTLMIRRILLALLFLCGCVFSPNLLASANSDAAPIVNMAHPASDVPASSTLTIPSISEGYSTHDGGWITFAFHPTLAARVGVLIAHADDVRTELTELLGQPVLGKVVVRVGRTALEMESLAPVGSRFPRYASGLAYSELGLVLLSATSRFPGQNHDLLQVFRHELAHIALHDAVGRENIPRWFNEGFAVRASGEAVTSRLSALSTASLSGNLLPFDRLTRSFPADGQTASVAYAQAADLIRFLLRSGEEHRFIALIQRVAQGQSFDAALQDAYSVDMYTLERQWLEDVARRYTFWPVIFGGSLIWVAALGLLGWGYIRRRRRAQVKLARWEKEEALEDARQQWGKLLLKRAASAVEEVGRAVGGSENRPPSAEKSVILIARPVPSVEHDGERHTLH